MPAPPSSTSVGSGSKSPSKAVAPRAASGTGGTVRQRSIRTSSSQFETLLQFMMDHERFGRGRLAGIKGRQKQTELWESLKDILNADRSGPVKDTRLWTKTWSDWKANTRKKASLLQNETSGTTLSAVETKLFEFLGPAGIADGTAPSPCVDTSSDESTGEVELEYKPNPNKRQLRTSRTSDNGAGPSKVAADNSRASYHTGGHGTEKKIKLATAADESDPLEDVVSVQADQNAILNSIDESVTMIATAMAEMAQAQTTMAQAHTAIASALVTFMNKYNY